MAEGDVLRIKAVPTCRKGFASGFVLSENNFGWTEVWELNPRRLGSLCPKVYATLLGIILFEGLHDRELAGCVTFTPWNLPYN
jgi:hypothetical protein